MYRTIYRERGVRGLWVGLFPNMARNSVVNATELVAYDSFKDLLIGHQLLNDGLTCHFSAGFAAGFMATLVASPIDVVKTRVMNGAEGASVIRCAKELALKDGFFGFYKGRHPAIFCFCDFAFTNLVINSNLPFFRPRRFVNRRICSFLHALGQLERVYVRHIRTVQIALLPNGPFRIHRASAYSFRFVKFGGETQRAA